MKVRLGFVSNSSSSSFTLCVPKGSTREEIEALIIRHLGIGKNFFIRNFERDAVDAIFDSIAEKTDILKEIEKQKEYLEKRYGEQEWIDWWQDKLDRNFDVYQGGFDTDGFSAEQLLCGQDFKVDKPDFFMENSKRE